jgi:hypothetical protein
VGPDKGSLLGIEVEHGSTPKIERRGRRTLEDKLARTV